MRFPMLSQLVIHALFLVACSSSPAPTPRATGIMIEGVMIRNELSFSVTDVRLLVPANGNFVSCGNIIARSQCSTTFPERNYTANAVVISWKERGQPQSTGEFVIKIPENIDPNRPTWLEIIIFNMGQAGAKLVQQSP